MSDAKKKRFDVARHNDISYEAPEPWDVWDEYAGSWVCRQCGAAAGYQIHNFGCVHRRCDDCVSNGKRD